MKEKIKQNILPFIIGLLVGAIITSGGFLIYSKGHRPNRNEKQMGGERPTMMQEDNNFKGRPDEDNTNNNSSKGNRQQRNSNSEEDRETPPEKPSGDDSSKDDFKTEKKQELDKDAKQNSKTTESNT